MMAPTASMTWPTLRLVNPSWLTIREITAGDQIPIHSAGNGANMARLE